MKRRVFIKETNREPRWWKWVVKGIKKQVLELRYGSREGDITTFVYVIELEYIKYLKRLILFISKIGWYREMIIRPYGLTTVGAFYIF